MSNHNQSVVDQFAETLKSIQDIANNKAAVHALNRTLASMKTLAGKDVKDNLGISLPRDIAKSKFRVTNATAASRAGKLSVIDRGTSFALFKPQKINVGTRNGQRTGVTVLITGQRVFLYGGFLAKLKSGQQAVFIRKTSAQYPLEFQKTMQISELFQRSDEQARMNAFARVTFQKNYASDLKFYLNRELSR